MRSDDGNAQPQCERAVEALGISAKCLSHRFPKCTVEIRGYLCILATLPLCCTTRKRERERGALQCIHHDARIQETASMQSSLLLRSARLNAQYEMS